MLPIAWLLLRGALRRIRARARAAPAPAAAPVALDETARAAASS
jgi:hypothetical protein